MFAKLNEGRLYSLFKTCIDVQTDLKTLVKSTVCDDQCLPRVSSSLLRPSSHVELSKRHQLYLQQ